MKNKPLLLILLLVVLCPLTVTLYAGGEKGAEGGKGPITVASKIDTEGALLGQMINHMLRANGFEVVDRTEFGPTDVIRKAIINGEIDLYPEYTGNGGFFYGNTEPSIWKNPQKGYETVKKLDFETTRFFYHRITFKMSNMQERCFREGNYKANRFMYALFYLSNSKCL